jgi:dynein heavy chain
MSPLPKASPPSEVSILLLQDHYDFGMRALKSVLVMAGVLKRASPDLPEDAVLVRAMRDANLPKFLSQDAVLFEAIIGDLFPDLSISAVDHGLLERVLMSSCSAVGLQANPPFIQKAVQLHETMVLRFGAMMVGPTGKWAFSACCQKNASC